MMGETPDYIVINAVTCVVLFSAAGRHARLACREALDRFLVEGYVGPGGDLGDEIHIRETGMVL